MKTSPSKAMPVVIGLLTRKSPRGRGPAPQADVQREDPAGGRALDDAGKVALLRREGLYGSLITELTSSAGQGQEGD